MCLGTTYYKNDITRVVVHAKLAYTEATGLLCMPNLACTTTIE